MTNTFKEITDRMKSRLMYEASKLEGSWTSDNIQAVANELAKIYSEDIDTILDKAFVSTSYGEWLDLACDDYGVIRNPATYAVAYLQITGRIGKYEPVEIAADDIVFITDSFTINDSGTAIVKATCKTAGSIGNVLAGTITKVKGNRENIKKAINMKNATGGFEQESDLHFAARCLEKIRMPATSGNIAHYRQWALEVSGVEKVKVFPLSRGKGTVDVVIIADNNSEAPGMLLEKIAEHIEESRPIGADVLVASAEPVIIEVKADVLVGEGYTAEDISYQIAQELEQYLKQIPFDNSEGFSGNILSYLKVADLLFGCIGVRDVTNYEINGRQSSIRLTDRQFPIVGIPVITLGGN